MVHKFLVSKSENMNNAELNYALYNNEQMSECIELVEIWCGDKRGKICVLTTQQFIINDVPMKWKMTRTIFHLLFGFCRENWIWLMCFNKNLSIKLNFHGNCCFLFRTKPHKRAAYLWWKGCFRMVDHYHYY